MMLIRGKLQVCENADSKNLVIDTNEMADYLLMADMFFNASAIEELIKTSDELNGEVRNALLFMSESFTDAIDNLRAVKTMQGGEYKKNKSTVISAVLKSYMKVLSNEVESLVQS